MNKTHWAAVVVAAVMGLTGGIYFASHYRRGDTEGATVKAIYATTLPDLAGHPQRLSQWKNKVLLVNFWATWCVPCRTEIPALIKIQTVYSAKNIQIVGIALDNPDQVQAFAKSLSINYPVLIGSLDNIDLTRSLGNRSGALPFTMVLAPDGLVLRSHLGAMTEAEMGSLIGEIQHASAP
jgi:thiol-disulfide isomerase/thioredoxin